MLISKIKRIKPKISKCVIVDSPNRLFVVHKNGLLTHNSVVQQNIIFSCVLRPKYWNIIGIDLKKVEITRFRNYGVNVADTLEQAIQYLRFGSQVMMNRYETMQKYGINNFLDLPGKQQQSLLIMIDEANELLTLSGGKSLSENTYIPNLKNKKNLKELKIGDTVFNSFSQPTKITNKYKPNNKQRFTVTIRNDDTNEKESVIAGDEHLWTIQLLTDNGYEEQVVDTKTLHQLFNDKKIIKFKKYFEDKE